MEMYFFLASICVLIIGGISAFFAGNRPRFSTAIGVGSAVTGGALGICSSLPVLAGGPEASIRLSWGLPLGSLHLGIDALSAFFLLPIFALPALAAVYGSEYMRPHEGKKPLGGHWFFFNLLVAGMAMTVAARDGFLFLVSWEVMSLAPFFLVTFNDELEGVRKAGWTYLIAAHLGALPLLALFVMLGGDAGSLDFSSIAAAGGPAPGLAGALFVLALVGFGTKAGFIPFHVWLPEAHPAAPSHVSAVMSGVMIKTGIYGILRVLTLIGPPSLWWGLTLVVIGLVTGIMGVLFAIAQHDMKRLLAYSSVENIGIITLGLGIGVIGQAIGSAALAALGYGGALLHVINHAAFKGLLFLGAGAVLHSAGTAAMDRLGGLHGRMPLTSAAFLVGAAAISGLPPFNGFASEFLIYLAGIKGGALAGTGAALASVLVVAGLALTGGLAAVCFAMAYGSVFLGEPRGGRSDAHEPGPLMVGPMLALAAACAGLGLFAPQAMGVLLHAVGAVAGPGAGGIAIELSYGAGVLSGAVLVFCLLMVLVLAAVFVRFKLLAGREVRQAVTWGCGFAAPAPRMQYTASSFAQPMKALVQPLLRIKEHLLPPKGHFPRAASFSTGIPGEAGKYLYGPAFTRISGWLSRFRWIQHGKLNIYVLYVAVTLVALLVWKI